MDKDRQLLKTASLVLLSSAALWAQQRSGLAGSTAITSSSDASQESGQSTVSSQGPGTEESVPATAAVPPLSGAGDFNPGSAGGTRSYLLPSFQYTGYADTNRAGAPGRRSEVDWQSTYVGSLTLQRVKRRSQLNLDYAGGAFFYSRRFAGDVSSLPLTNGTYHRGALTQSVKWRRWGLMLSDQVSYLPESAFGFGGFGGLTSFGSGLGGQFFGSPLALNPRFEPNQTILAGRGRRLSNMAVAEIQYNPGARSTITATGGYGVLHFLDSGFINSRYWTFLTGYNHLVTPRDVVSVSYVHSFIQLDVNNFEILNRGFQLSYGRRVTGRLSLQLSAGPVASQITLPLGGFVTRIFLDTYDSLQYTFRKGSVGISFVRQTTAGAGVLRGAETDLAQLTIGRQLSRRVHGALRFGHAYNQSLLQESVATRRSKYEAWQGGATLSHEFGQHMSVYIDYHAQRQTSNNPFCFGDSCGSVLLRHVGGVGLNWHGRPIRLD